MINLNPIIEQRSQEWKDQRTGFFTASECFKLMTDPRSAKDDFSGTALTYIITKASERLTGYSNEAISEAMVWGIQAEPKAKAIYEIETDREVQEVGFITIEGYNFGGSPDGLCEDRGLEIKCPYNSAKALEYYLCQTSEDLLKAMPAYWWQCQACMLVTGMAIWDFVVFDVHLYEKFGLKILTLEADKEAQAELLKRVAKATDKMNEIMASL
jgi:hypothetical protein